MDAKKSFPPAPPAPEGAPYTDDDVQRLRALLIDGLNSPVDGWADDDFFDRLMERANARPKGSTPR